MIPFLFGCSSPINALKFYNEITCNAYPSTILLFHDSMGAFLLAAGTKGKTFVRFALVFCNSFLFHENLSWTLVPTMWLLYLPSFFVIFIPNYTGKRHSLPNSRIMIHQPLGGVQGGQSDVDIQVCIISDLCFVNLSFMHLVFLMLVLYQDFNYSKQVVFSIFCVLLAYRTWNGALNWSMDINNVICESPHMNSHVQHGSLNCTR